MPSGPKKRRAAKRKQEKAQQSNQTDEFTTVSVVKLSIPIEKLAKVADVHEAKNTIVEVSENYRNTIQESSEVPLLEVTSKGEPLVSQSADCFIGSVESGENLKQNESCGVACNDNKETELEAGVPEPNFEHYHDHDLLSHAMTPEEFLERDVRVGAPGEAAEVEVLTSNEAVSVVKEFEESKRPICEVPVVSKDVSVVDNDIEENEDSLLKVASNVDKVMSKDEAIVPQNAGCAFDSSSKDHELLSIGVPEEKIETATLVSGTMLFTESIKEEENTSKFHELLSVVLPREMIKDSALMDSSVSKVNMEAENTSLFNDQSAEAADGMKDAAALISKNESPFYHPGLGLPVLLAEPSSDEHVKESGLSAENADCASADLPLESDEMLAVPEGLVYKNHISEIHPDSQDMQSVPTGSVSLATENLVYFACPTHCTPECQFAKMMSGVVDIKLAIHSLKKDLLKALDKLDAISY